MFGLKKFGHIGAVKHAAASAPAPAPEPSGLPVTAGLALWMDASDVSTLELSGAQVLAWTDKVAGREFSWGMGGWSTPTASALKLPHRCVDFGSGSNSYMQTTNPLVTGDSITVFAAAYTVPPDGPRATSILQSGAMAGSIQNASASPLFAFFNAGPDPRALLIENGVTGSTYASFRNAYEDNTLSVVSMISRPSLLDATAAVNGAPVARTNGASGTGFASMTFDTIGSSDGYYLSHGAFGEILVFDRVLNPAEIAAVTEYLQAKWAIPTPEALPVTDGLALWMDAADPSTLTVSEDAEMVTTWTDKASGRLFTSGEYGGPSKLNPDLMQHNCVDFGNGTRKYFETTTPLTTGSEITVFAAQYWRVPVYIDHSMSLLQAGSPSNSITDSTAGPAVFMFSSSDNPSTIHLAAAVPGYASTENNAIPEDESSIVAITFPSMEGAVFEVNGVVAAKAYGVSGPAYETMTFDVIGSTDSAYGANGAFGEIVVFNRILTAPEMASMTAYLKAKWGVT